MQHIKNIIFDLGGIFINVDFKKTELAFTNLGVADFHAFYNQHHASELFELLETGKITPADFCNQLCSETGIQLTHHQIIDAWNMLLLDFPIERIHWLQQIAEKYKVFLFSNTNQIHHDAFTQIFRKQTGLPDFDSLFIKAYYSHQLGLRKPYPESFLHILKEQSLNAEETLFIDDTLSNIEGAKQAGLHTIHLVSPHTMLGLPL